MKRASSVKERISKREALRRVYPEAYEQAEAGLGYAEFRMFGYAARRLVEQQFGIPADSITISPNGDHGEAWRSAQREHPKQAAAMNIYFGPRGRDRAAPQPGPSAGTAAVREYVEAWGSPRLGHGLSPEMFTVGLHVSAIGPEGCYGGLLVIEKDGLLPWKRRRSIAAST